MFVENQLVRPRCPNLYTLGTFTCTLLTRIFVQYAGSKLIVNRMEQLKIIITSIDERKFIPVIYEIHALILIKSYLLLQVNLVRLFNFRLHFYI